nr:hypothetical protein [Tanacetum cinerariifolium]
MPLFPSPDPSVSCIDDFNFFRDCDNEFLAIVYNDAITSKSYFSTEPTLCPQCIDEFNLKDETTLSECDEKEQIIFYFNDLFPFNVIYPDDLKSDTDNDNDKIDIEQASGDMSVIKIIYMAYLNPMDMGIDYLDVIRSLFFSTVDTAYSLNEYSIFDTGPSGKKSAMLVKYLKFEDVEVLKS